MKKLLKEKISLEMKKMRRLLICLERKIILQKVNSAIESLIRDFEEIFQPQKLKNGRTFLRNNLKKEKTPLQC